METDEPLETGYGPQTPPGDNACNDYVRGLCHGYGSLARGRGDRVVDEPDLLLVDAGSPSLFCNFAVVRRPLSEGEWEKAVGRMAEFFGAGPGGSYLLFSAWPSPDLTNWDFGRIGHPPLMFRPPGPVAVPAVDGVEIRPVDDASSARDWEWALVEGFPLEELQPFKAGWFLSSSALEAPGWRHWIACQDGDPVGSASAYDNSTHVEVEFISTIETVRGRGVGRALTATATAVAGHRPAMLIASDLGRRLYERLGYHSISRVTLWAGHRPA